jgi:hypothetical protein
LDFFNMYFIQHCFICRPSDSTVSEDAEIKYRTVATWSLTFRHSNHSARSHSDSARSHPYSAKSHPHSARSPLHSARSHPHAAKSYPHSARSHQRSATSHPKNLRRPNLRTPRELKNFLRKPGAHSSTFLWHQFLHFFCQILRSYMTLGQFCEGNIFLIALPSIFILCS